jgi:hypothetical protein
MSTSDAFALKNSGLNEFLLAEVGTGVNGLPLTILSVLARLGKDPWTEAAQWARLPKASVIDRLADSILQMPLRPQALVEARVTAARLILLLPGQVQQSPKIDDVKNMISTTPKWVPMAVFLAALAFGIAFEMVPPTSPVSAVIPSVGQTIPSPNPPVN